MNDDPVERRTTTFHGRVQGVGFRYTTQQIARAHPVSGYVRNLANGDVEVVVEGTNQALDRFLGQVAARMQRCIEDVRAATEPATGEFQGFDIRY